MNFMTKYYNTSNHIRRIISVSDQIVKIFSLALFASVLFLVTSCEENPTKIGNELLPNYDFVSIKSIDTLSVRSFTNFNDSTRTDNPSVSFLGQIVDPYFGTTTTEFVSQVRLGSAWDDLPFVIDSVKLFMTLLHVKGGTDAGYTLKLSEIADQIYTDSAYYSHRKVNTTGYNISVDLPSFKADTINDISVKLPISFAQYLTRDTAKLFYSSSKPDFRSFFKGLYFQITPSSNPTLLSLSLAAQATSTGYYNYIVVYMHDDTSPKNYFFILDAVNPNARYNRFLHDFSTASPDKRIQHVNDGKKDTLSYLQYLNGVYTKLTFPGLESIKDNPLFDNIAVNKARITIPVYFDGNFYKASKVPAALRLRYVSNTGTRFDVPDYAIDASHSFFNGTLDSINNVYVFNIVKFVQGYLKDTKGLLKPELEVYQSTTSALNVILKANNSKTPVKFDFTYTKF